MSRQDKDLWIREGGDRGKWRDAGRARLNRREIQQALSSGEVSRRLRCGSTASPSTFYT
jgi:hypothetical protein